MISLNRLDEIILFHGSEKERLSAIVDLMIGDLNACCPTGS